MCYLADLLLLRILHVNFLSYPFVIKFPSLKSLASSACNMLNESSDNANFYYMAGGCRGAGDGVTPPIFLEIRKKVVFSTPNVSGLHE